MVLKIVYEWECKRNGQTDSIVCVRCMCRQRDLNIGGDLRPKIWSVERRRRLLYMVQSSGPISSWLWRYVTNVAYECNGRVDTGVIF